LLTKEIQAKLINVKIRLIFSILTALTAISCKHEDDLSGIPHPEQEPTVVVPCPDSLSPKPQNPFNMKNIYLLIN
jgi:hypothetical protein